MWSQRGRHTEEVTYLGAQVRWVVGRASNGFKKGDVSRVGLHFQRVHSFLF